MRFAAFLASWQISLMSSFSSLPFHDEVTWRCHTFSILQIIQVLASQWGFSRGQSGVIISFGFVLLLKSIWVFTRRGCELWCGNFSLRTVHAWSLGKMHKHRFLSKGMDKLGWQPTVLQISEINVGASLTLSADPKGMLNYVLQVFVINTNPCGPLKHLD